MSSPIFSKAGTPDVVISQAPDLSSTTPIRPRQRLQRFYAGGYGVITKGVEDDIFNLIFGQILDAEADALEVFFRSEAVNFSEHAFTYTDHNAVDYQVRFLQGNLPGIPNGSGTRRLSLSLAIDRGTVD